MRKLIQKATVGWLNRRQVAAVLGVDERRIKSMDGRELHPIVGRDRSCMYAPREIGKMAAFGGTASGALTAQVFALLRDGAKSLPDIAIETLQSARQIRELCADYDDLAGSLTLDKATVDGLRALLGDDAVLNGERLLATVHARLESQNIKPEPRTSRRTSKRPESDQAEHASQELAGLVAAAGRLLREKS